MNNASLISIAALEKQWGAHANELLVRLIPIFLEHSAKHIENIKVAWAEADFERLQKCAHTFKSAAANVGAAQLAELCKQLENANRGQSAEALESLLGQLFAVYAETCTALIELGNSENKLLPPLSSA